MIGVHLMSGAQPPPSVQMRTVQNGEIRFEHDSGGVRMNPRHKFRPQGIRVPGFDNIPFRFLRASDIGFLGERRMAVRCQHLPKGVQTSGNSEIRFIGQYFEISPMILRQAYSIVEESKRAMAGKPKAESDAIREETIRKIRELCEKSLSNFPTNRKNP